MPAVAVSPGPDEGVATSSSASLSASRPRLDMTPAEPGDLAEPLDYLREEAGYPTPTTPGLRDALCASPDGNPVAFAVSGDGLLAARSMRAATPEPGDPTEH